MKCCHYKCQLGDRLSEGWKKLVTTRLTPELCQRWTLRAMHRFCIFPWNLFAKASKTNIEYSKMINNMAGYVYFYVKQSGKKDKLPFLQHRQVHLFWIWKKKLVNHSLNAPFKLNVFPIFTFHIERASHIERIPNKNMNIRNTFNLTGACELWLTRFFLIKKKMNLTML